MEQHEQRLDEEQVRSLSTPALMRHALSEAKLLVRAEVMHAKQELREELKQAQSAGILLGAAAVLALCALSALVVMVVALALPVAPWLGALMVGAAVLLIAGGLGFMGYRKLPKQPLPLTQKRIINDVTEARREVLQ